MLWEKDCLYSFEEIQYYFNSFKCLPFYLKYYIHELLDKNYGGGAKMSILGSAELRG